MEHTADTLMVGADYNQKDDVVRLFTRCPEHGEQEVFIPMQHVAVIAQSLMRTLIVVKGIEGLLDALDAADSIQLSARRQSRQRVRDKMHAVDEKAMDRIFEDMLRSFNAEGKPTQ